MKRYICLCLTLLMSISMLAGCTFTSVQVEPISEVGNSGISVASNEPVETVVDKENLPKVEEVKPDGENITVKFIDVGQADSCLIITPDKEAILIDAGENKDAEEIIPELEEDIPLVIIHKITEEQLSESFDLKDFYTHQFYQDF